MKATYHQDDSTRVILDVLEEPKDGLATLGQAEQVLVTGCLISESGAPGTCTLVKEEEAAEGSPKAKKAK